MFINNKISKLFDGSFQLLGYTFLLAFFLLALNEKWVACGVNLIPALYILFTSTGVEIDTNTQNYRKYYAHFSLLKTGKWKSLDGFKGLTLIPMKNTYGFNSLSNRSISNTKKSYQVFLIDKEKKPAFAIKKCKTASDGYRSLDEFAIWLKLPVYSVKR